MSGMEPLAIASLVGSVGATAYGAYSSISAARESGAAQQQQIGAQVESLGVSREATLMAAREQSAAQEFEGRQLDLQSKRIRSAAAVDEAQRREGLQSSLETIQSVRAGRGLDLNSPTGRAIAAGVTVKAERNIEQSKSNYLIDAAESDMTAELSRRKARYSLLAGDAQAKGIDAQIMAVQAGGRAAAATTAGQIDTALAGGLGKIAGIGLDSYRLQKFGGSRPGES